MGLCCGFKVLTSGKHPSGPELRWHAACFTPYQKEIGTMVYWRGQPLDSLPRTDLERAANDAIEELMGLRDTHKQRESHEGVILGFMLGATFSAIAVLVGILLH
jgi:hypothetical protein